MTWSHPILDAPLRELDEASQDIRSLEGYLQGHAALVFAGVRLESGEQVTWAQVPPGPWRIWYIPVDGSGPARPLIETPSEMRLRCRPMLPKLLEAVAKALMPGAA